MILKHRDKELLRFEWIEPQGVRIVSVDEGNNRYLPLDFKGEVSDENLWKWLSRRVVPRNRRNIDALMAAMGLEARNVRGIIEICRGLSLNDVHWVVPNDFKGSWKDCNLYDNEFSQAIALTAFNGMGSAIERLDWISSPEFSTNGMLAKCWRRIDGRVALYKSGTDGAANTGFEPYSEYYASQIAAAMGLDHVEYSLSKFKGYLCSTCNIFTSDKLGYLPAGRIMNVAEALEDKRFADIFFFDALIFNTDRHLGNFGYLVDNDKNEIVGAAPIFDNGYGLFSLALYRPGDRLDEFSDLAKYVSRVKPALYSKWLGFPGGITKSMLERMKALKGFRFKRHKYYNLPQDRLRSIEKFLQSRILQIEEFAQKADDIFEISTKCGTVNPVNNESLALQIIANLKADPFVSYDELSELMGVPRRTVARRIKELADAGRIRRVGAAKNGHWEVLRGQD
ncbi:MAG: winged helix-turn-helix transcriptional regulator [Kiritimatiellae bacterium]|nr:winged helix-turn-helix transcriptional regulator [Kiritimatiellia bacterium]